MIQVHSDADISLTTGTVEGSPGFMRKTCLLVSPALVDLDEGKTTIQVTNPNNHTFTLDANTTLAHFRIPTPHQAHPRESPLHPEYTETSEEPYNKQLHMTLDRLIAKNSHKLTSQDKQAHNDTLIIFTCNSFGHASRIGSLTNSFSLVCR